MGGTRTHVLIIVQNLPVPLDRRVWLECQALVARGYQVSVICPKGPGDPGYQEIQGVHVHKYRPAPEAHGVGGFVMEFTYSWLRTAWLSGVIWRRQRFDIIQACNPPDTYWLLAKLWASRGVKFVFDQHDLNPELFLSRFGEPKTFAKRLQFQGLVWLERMTYRTATKVISTNESYKRIALTRGKRAAADVTVVRSGPDTRQMRPIYPDPSIRGDARSLLVYLGIMGPQDGVDLVLEVMDELVHRRGRTDVHAALLGFGDCLENLKQQCHELGLDPWVTFTGRADKSVIAQYLSAADVGLCPDIKTPLNDISTMNKTMEYMAYALPSVSFDLVETRVSAREAAVYVKSGDTQAFTDAVEQLLDDPDRRVQMGMLARRRVVDVLDWLPQSQRYVDVFNQLSGRAGPPDPTTLRTTDHASAGRDEHHRKYVDLTANEELARFIHGRTRIVDSSSHTLSTPA